ncbi:hypothetical protein [Erwinia psidii]|uniref:hypothetical protein n=1 Tax=Erwinia psidii TaxID=69224 RepID=UPI00226B6586|nr:hypothetical protein [Erwinia psidii]
MKNNVADEMTTGRFARRRCTAWQHETRYTSGEKSEQCLYSEKSYLLHPGTGVCRSYPVEKGSKITIKDGIVVYYSECAFSAIWLRVTDYQPYSAISNHSAGQFYTDDFLQRYFIDGLSISDLIKKKVIEEIIFQIHPQLAQYGSVGGYFPDVTFTGRKHLPVKKKIKKASQH